MHLTTKEMDDINIQLTEVSLELLGNKFFDIHGQVCTNLSDLCRTNKKPTSTYNVGDSELLKTVGIHMNTDDTFKTILKLQRKRRSSDAASKSLGAPVGASSPSPSSFTSTNGLNFRKRRNTVVVRPTITALSSAKPPSSSSSSSSTLLSTPFLYSNVVSSTTGGGGGGVSSSKTPSALANNSLLISPSSPAPQRRSDSYEIIEAQLKDNVGYESERMLKMSQQMYEKLAQKNAATGKEFYNDEKVALIRESCALIEFIKFIKAQPENTPRMAKISKVILNVKDKLQ